VRRRDRRQDQRDDDGDQDGYCSVSHVQDASSIGTVMVSV
jgi:hypothetical protein